MIVDKKEDIFDAIFIFSSALHSKLYRSFACVLVSNKPETFGVVRPKCLVSFSISN